MISVRPLESPFESDQRISWHNGNFSDILAHAALNVERIGNESDWEGILCEKRLGQKIRDAA